MSNSPQNAGPPEGRQGTPVPSAQIPVDDARMSNLPPTENPLSGRTPLPLSALCRTQVPPSAHPRGAEQSVFAADPVNLAECTQNNSNTISASGGSTSYRTVPVANSAMRGDRIMLQNSLLASSGDSVTRKRSTPPRKGGAQEEMMEVSPVKSSFADPNRPHRGADSSSQLGKNNSGRGEAAQGALATDQPNRPAAVFSRQEGVAPLSESVKNLRQHNIWLSLLLVAVAVVLAVIGGVGIGVVSHHYTKVASVNSLELKNRIVLNSSLASLTDSSNALVSQAQQLDEFVVSKASNYGTPAAIRDDLREDFIAAWALWLHGQSRALSLYSIKVPFCENLSELTSCDTGMVLSIQCDPPGAVGPAECYFSENSDNGTTVSVYQLVYDTLGLHSLGELVGMSDYASVYKHIRVNTTDGLFLVPSYVTGPDTSLYYFLKFAQQNQLLGGQTVLIETGSFLKSWFNEYQRHMQSAPDSISVLFADSGSVLEYNDGPEVRNPTQPCGFTNGDIPPHRKTKDCDTGAGALVDDFVSAFVDQLPDKVLNEGVISSSAYACRLNVDQYTVAYQEFLRFRTPLHQPNTVFFAAYATPIDTGIGKEGVIQVVICIVIIVVCLLILGCITLLTVMSLQRVVEMVSVVANYAATYDTDAMLRVLNKAPPRLMPSTSASAAVRQEFFRILENLMAYRPFLPPALLTAEGLASLSETSTDSQHVASRPPTPTPPATRRVPSPITQDAEPDYPHSQASPHSTQAPRPDSLTEYSQSTSVAIRGVRSESDAWVNEAGGVKAGTNARLIVNGLRVVKGTILAAYLTNADVHAERMAQLINAFVRAVLQAAEAYNGVVDVLDATHVVVSFNCHFTTLGHSDKACKCALRIKHDLRHTGCAVAMGICTGMNYLGTIGTDRQKARVVTGECVAVARSLVRLRYYLGTTILATESTVHVSTCVSVPVDVVASFSEGSQLWRQHVVWEVLDVPSLEMDPQAALAKKLFRMIRSRQGKAALAAAEAYVANTGLGDEHMSWRLLRMVALLKRQQPLIARGYVRCQTYWQNLEFTDTAPQTEAEVEAGFMAALGEAKDEDPMLAHRTGRDETARVDLMSNPNEEASRVRQILGAESSRISATKRRMVALHQQRDPEDSDDALFDVYMPDPVDPEDGPESAPPSTSQRTTAAEPLQPQDSRNISSDPHGTIQMGRGVGYTGSGEYSVTEDLRESPIAPQLPVELVSGAGQRFYRTSEILGRGTYGNVFLAISQRGLFVAVKVFPVDEFNTAQLMREVDTLAQLRSDYIVAYDCCGVQSGFFFICTEYLAGGSLRSLLKSVPRLPSSVVRKYARDILLGLQYLHARNWTHCDIKPENVLLSGDGVCKLADFGNAALARSWSEDKSSMRGTARYMAPEAVLSEWRPPADIFSLGITMVYMLTGRQPWHAYPERDHLFVARYAGEIRHAVEKNEPCAMQPDLSMPEAEADDIELCQIVRQCCSFRASDRPTVDALLNYMT